MAARNTPTGTRNGPINTGINTLPVNTSTPPVNTGTSENVIPNPLKEKEDKEETVNVPKETLESLIKELNDLKQEVRTNKQEFEKTASQDQIRKIEALRAQGKLVKSIKISVLSVEGKDKMVKSWRSTADEVYVDAALGKEVSRQMTLITFFDNTTLELSQVEFARRKRYVEYEVISEGKDRDGMIALTFVTSDGQEFNIDSRFIN